MVLVIMGFFILLLIIGVKTADDNDFVLAGFGIFGVLVSLVITVCLIGSVVNSKYIDEKIAMYIEENESIETNVGSAVATYMDHENKTFVEITLDSMIMLATLYPELKADTLVTKQIDVYISNNEMIKELRLRKINYKVKKWWLYFGVNKRGN